MVSWNRQRWIAGAALALASSTASAAWVSSVKVSPTDGARTLSLSTRSASGTHSEQLMITCSPGETQIRFNAGRVISRATTYGSAIRLKYDAGEPIAMIASRSTDFRAVFLESPEEQLRSLVKGKRLVLEYSPLYEGPRVAEFDLAGLGQHLPLLKQYCRL